MSEKPTTELDEDPSVHLSLGEDSYSRPHPADKDNRVPATIDHSTVGQGRVGASPIRWGWWLTGLVVSVGLWIGLSFLFGWL